MERRPRRSCPTCSSWKPEMIAVIVRMTRAGLRGHAWQSLLAGLIVAAAAATMTLALDVRRSADAPFDRILAATHGPHVIVSVDGSQVGRLERLAALPGIEARTPTTRAGLAPAQIGRDDTEVLLAERRSNDVAVGKLLMRSGRFAARSGEVVVDRTFARNVHIRPGETLRVRGSVLRVVGTATTSERGPYPHWAPGIIWVQPATFDALRPRGVQAYVGL